MRRIRISEPVINWVWFIEVDLDEAEKTAKILAHYRVHQSENQPASVREADRARWHRHLIESDQPEARTVVALSWKGENYTVTNPGHVFGYPETYQFNPGLPEVDFDQPYEFNPDDPDGTLAEAVERKRYALRNMGLMNRSANEQ